MIATSALLVLVFLILATHAAAVRRLEARVAILEEKVERLHPWDWELNR